QIKNPKKKIEARQRRQRVEPLSERNDGVQDAAWLSFEGHGRKLLANASGHRGYLRKLCASGVPSSRKKGGGGGHARPGLNPDGGGVGERLGLGIGGRARERLREGHTGTRRAIPTRTLAPNPLPNPNLPLAHSRGEASRG